MFRETRSPTPGASAVPGLLDFRVRKAREKIAQVPKKPANKPKPR